MVHSFGILDEFDRRQTFNEYNPWEYDCVSVHDDLVCGFIGKLSAMKTYFHSLDRPEHGLAYCGITLIPPESSSLFHDAVTSSEHFGDSDQLARLASTITQAMKAGKYMIHFGI
jgi:hypothetical protein